jgi:Isopropylmalate/homocitrate/citramalate synthases
MIKIIDRTLSCLDNFSIDADSLKKLMLLLLKLNCDKLEISEKVYQAIKPLPPKEKFILRVHDICDLEKYPEFKEFVCESVHIDGDRRICKEFQMNSVGEMDQLGARTTTERIRLSGLDDILLSDYTNIFKKLKNVLKGPIEFCPMNRMKCATAIAMEWAFASDNAEIVTSFGSLNHYVPLEELIMALYMHHCPTNHSECRYFAKIRDLIENATHVPFAKHKAVIGKEIFQVESGIHVDGIMKNSLCYEPYNPELVGQKREIILGKKSGRASLTLKMKQLHLKLSELLLPQILQQVKELSIEKNDCVSDQEFIQIVNDVTRMNSIGAFTAKVREG